MSLKTARSSFAGRLVRSTCSFWPGETLNLYQRACPERSIVPVDPPLPLPSSATGSAFVQAVLSGPAVMQLEGADAV